MSKGISPVQRSLAEMRGRGWIAAVVEHWNPHAFIRQDLFGIFDLLALTDRGILAVQVKGTGDGVVKAQEKMASTPAARRWLDGGGRIEVWVWRKVKLERGKKAMRWRLRIVSAEACGESGIAWHEEEET